MRTSLTVINFGQNSEFLHGFRTADHGLEDAWDEIHRPPVLHHAQGREGQPHFAEFEQIYDHSGSSALQPTWDGMLSDVFFLLLLLLLVIIM